MEIQGFPNYLIYPDGRVWSKIGKGRFLKPYHQGTPYLFVKLCDRSNHLIHRLVAKHYIPNTDNKPCVDHVNRNKTDNTVQNLRWATHSENSLNTGIQKRNNTGYKWITLCKSRNSMMYCFQRKDCKRKSSVNISKMLCYSFFYILKSPLE